MIITDVGAYAKYAPSVRAVRQAAGVVNGVSFDRIPSSEQVFHSCVIFASMGAVQGGPSAQTLDVKLQDSADNSAFTDVSGETIAQLAAANSDGSKSVILKGLRRYIRLVATVGFTGGASPTADITAGFIMGGGTKLPV